MEVCISGKKQRQLREKQLSRGAQEAETNYAVDGEISGIGVALALALCGLVIALSTGLFELSAGSVLSDAVLSFAIAFWFWGLSGLILEFGEIKKFATGFNQEGWENFLISAVFVVPAIALLFGVWFFELPMWIDLPFKLVTAALGLVGALCVAATMDAFFIKPRISGRLKGQRTGSNTAKDRAVLGSIGAFITWLLANVVNLLVIVDRLFPSL